MRALTLPQPIPECVLRHGQRVLRRSEAPSPEILGERVALHSSEHIEHYHRDHRFPPTGYLDLGLPLVLPRSAVVATARICGFFVAECERRGGSEWAAPSPVDPRRAELDEGLVLVGSAFSPRVEGAVLAKVRSELLASPWWNLSGLYCPVLDRDVERARAHGGDTFVEGAIRAFGWLLDDVREIDPPVSTVRPLRSHVHHDQTWELGRVAGREVSMREAGARCA